jgi:hypothetical protein
MYVTSELPEEEVLSLQDLVTDWCKQRNLNRGFCTIYDEQLIAQETRKRRSDSHKMHLCIRTCN